MVDAGRACRLQRAQLDCAIEKILPEEKNGRLRQDRCVAQARSRTLLRAGFAKSFLRWNPWVFHTMWYPEYLAREAFTAAAVVLAAGERSDRCARASP